VIAGYLIIYVAVFLAAIGQVMLKIGAGRGGFHIGIMCLNVWIALGLGVMVISMLLSVRGLNIVPLRDIAFILPSVYIAVPVFSRIFLKEKLSVRTIAGTFIIIAGIMVFNIPAIRLF
jgi:drug/metabolite transporter (DMT)-like permease